MALMCSSTTARPRARAKQTGSNSTRLRTRPGERFAASSAASALRSGPRPPAPIFAGEDRLDLAVHELSGGRACCGLWLEPFQPDSPGEVRQLPLRGPRRSATPTGPVYEDRDPRDSLHDHEQPEHPTSPRRERTYPWPLARRRLLAAPPPVCSHRQSVICTLSASIRNVVDGSRTVAWVIDDMVSFDPFIARGIRCMASRILQSSASGLSGPASTSASRPARRGAGTWMATPSATRGTRCGVLSTRPPPTRLTVSPPPGRRTDGSDLDREVTT
jgi:hypothetical protein